MNQPLISVIIPTYNEAPLLEVAVRSIMNQTYKNLEIIVADDGSTDETEPLVKRLSAEDSRVIYLKNPHLDPKRTDIRGTNISVGYLARNYAMDTACGEWITFQDADDASLLNRIETQLALAQEFNATCVTTSWIKFDDARTARNIDAARFRKTHPDFVVRPEEIAAIARASKGLLMRENFPHHLVPFVFKKRLPTRPLFLGTYQPYPGADNSPFFKRDTVRNVRFRKRDERMWPATSGRGVGRDHLFQLAVTYNNSYSFKIPLYLWRQAHENSAFSDINSYLV